MLSNDDLNEIEKSFMNKKSQDFIKILLLFAGTIIVYSLFY